MALSQNDSRGSEYPTQLVISLLKHNVLIGQEELDARQGKDVWMGPGTPIPVDVSAIWPDVETYKLIEQYANTFTHLTLRPGMSGFLTRPSGESVKLDRFLPPGREYPASISLQEVTKMTIAFHGYTVNLQMLRPNETLKNDGSAASPEAWPQGPDDITAVMVSGLTEAELTGAGLFWGLSDVTAHQVLKPQTTFCIGPGTPFPIKGVAHKTAVVSWHGPQEGGILHLPNGTDWRCRVQEPADDQPLDTNALRAKSGRTHAMLNTLDVPFSKNVKIALVIGSTLIVLSHLS